MKDGEVWIGPGSSEQQEAFRVALTKLLNEHNIDSFTGTPDFILTESIIEHVLTWRLTRIAIARWDGLRVHYMGDDTTELVGKTS